jgi:hypothetical protein
VRRNIPAQFVLFYPTQHPHFTAPLLHFYGTDIVWLHITMRRCVFENTPHDGEGIGHRPGRQACFPLPAFLQKAVAKRLHFSTGDRIRWEMPDSGINIGFQQIMVFVKRGFLNLRLQILQPITPFFDVIILSGKCGAILVFLISEDAIRALLSHMANVILIT